MIIFWRIAIFTIFLLITFLKDPNIQIAILCILAIIADVLLDIKKIIKEINDKF